MPYEEQIDLILERRSTRHKIFLEITKKPKRKAKPKKEKPLPTVDLSKLSAEEMANLIQLLENKVKNDRPQH